MRRLKFRDGLVGVALVCAGLAAGAVVTPSHIAQAEIRATPPPNLFQSGGQLSVPVLKEIATTLHQIDARLARLEAVAQKMQKVSEADRKPLSPRHPASE
jgi:hypothetical protein